VVKISKEGVGKPLHPTVEFIQKEKTLRFHLLNLQVAPNKKCNREVLKSDEGLVGRKSQTGFRIVINVVDDV